MAEGGARAAPPASRPPARRAPAVAVEESTLEECWGLLCKGRENEPRAKVEQAWFDLLDKTAPGKDSGDFTPADWGLVKAALDDLPF